MLSRSKLLNPNLLYFTRLSQPTQQKNNISFHFYFLGSVTEERSFLVKNSLPMTSISLELEFLLISETNSITAENYRCQVHQQKLYLKA